MRKNFGAKALTYPQPVYIIGSYDEDGTPNAMNAAWGGVCGGNKISLCLTKVHKTVANIKKTGEFTISIGTEKYLKECDYVGLVSGNKVPDKLKVAGFTAVKAENVNAPMIEELPMCIECKMESYDDETEILIGEIVNVSVDESVLTDGRIDPKKIKPIIFDSGNMRYWSFGEIVGKAFKDGKELIK